MFENTPSVRETFEKFRELDDDPAVNWVPRGRLASSDVLRTHGMVVMNAIDEIISSLDENSEVIQLILEQGQSHARFSDNLTPESFWVRLLHAALGVVLWQENKNRRNYWHETDAFAVTHRSHGYFPTVYTLYETQGRVIMGLRISGWLITWLCTYVRRCQPLPLLTSEANKLSNPQELPEARASTYRVHGRL